MSVDLDSLPVITFAPLQSETCEAQIISAYERLAGTTLYPGDPLRLFLESVAWFGTVQNNLIDLAARQNLLAYAQGANLDHLGALMGVSRIPAQPARCVARFSLSQALNFNVPVPEGTRITTRDGKAIFKTVTASVIPAGDVSVNLPVICLEAGSIGSGLLPGQIDSLVDPIPYIASVENIETSIDGANAESDERLRERIRLAPESFTVAGSSGEYEARTLEVSSDIASVSVTSPEPGVVDVRLVLTGGELPDAAMCELVETALSAETVRPLTDKVLVAPPDPVPYSINGVWYASAANATMLGVISAKVAEALETYRLWQRKKPGRDIVPSKLIELIQQAGVKRIELTEPVFTEVAPTEIAREESVNLEFGGLETE